MPILLFFFPSTSLLISFLCHRGEESLNLVSAAQYMQNNRPSEDPGGTFLMLHLLLDTCLSQLSRGFAPGEAGFVFGARLWVAIVDWIKLSLCHLNVTISQAVMMTFKLKQRWWLPSHINRHAISRAVRSGALPPAFCFEDFYPPSLFPGVICISPAWLLWGHSYIRTHSSMLSVSQVFPAKNVTFHSNLVLFA